MEYDLHIHSRFSFDSRSDPARIVAAAKKTGLRGIAVTDHDSIEGGLAAQAIAGPDLIVVVGMEATTEGGDLIGLYLKEAVVTQNPFEFVAGVKSQGGIVFIPHPFRYHVVPDEELLAQVDGIEGYNGRSSRLREVDPTWGEPKVERVAKEHDLFVVSGSDAHRPSQVGRGRTVVPAATAEDLRRELMKGNTLLCGPRRSALAHVCDEVKGAVADRVRQWIDKNRNRPQEPEFGFSRDEGARDETR